MQKRARVAVFQPEWVSDADVVIHVDLCGQLSA